MKKYLVILLALFMALLVQSRAFCADGDELTTTSFRVNSSGQVVNKVLNELFTTNDTLTAAETGKVCAIDAASSVVIITLPAAAAGLHYKFVGADTTAFWVRPASTSDTIKLLTLSAGDTVGSSGAVGDSLELFATTTGTWYATPSGGTFVDRN